jgi:predicted AlkP superfamily pyrophosphatase or phosphodiesterase
MRRLVVLNVVGLTPSLIGPHTPRLAKLRDGGAMAAIRPCLPAVTCSVQSTYLTGLWPDQHGIVGNGWYFRDLCEPKFWHQSNKLVSGEKVWETARRLDPTFTCANLFWWYNMHSSVNLAVTPRPMYPADGRKLPDIHTRPGDLRHTLQNKLGQFPLFKFWGPASSIESTQWIASSAIEVDRARPSSLTLIYLPHLDYTLQQYGPDSSKLASELAAVDAEIGRLVDHFGNDCDLLVLSEYGITPVSRPIHVNRLLRQLGLLMFREELGRELIDYGESRAFALVDHQIAHVYINDAAAIAEIAAALRQTPGIAAVYVGTERRAIHLDHPRAGDVVAIADSGAWFTYYYWTDDARAPDFARTVDIHRKPGYDPVELFLDPAIRYPKLKIASTLAKRKLGMRAMMDVIPLDASLVRGSHGAAPPTPAAGPLLLTTRPELLERDVYDAVEIRDLILRHLRLS